MKPEILLEQVINSTEAFVYASDCKTYDLLYINPSFRTFLGSPDESTYLNKKCYEFLFGADTPCSCCSMDLISANEFHNWRCFSSIFKIPLNMNTIIVNHEKRRVRLGMITNQAHGAHERELKERIEEHEILNKCINLLHSSIPIQESINKALSYIANYYQAERAYIFEFVDSSYTSNTYEWCKKGILPQIDNLQNVPLEELSFWIDNFNAQGEFYIDSLSTNPIHKNAPYYKALAEQGIESLVAAPLIDIAGSKIVGFLGVDNPVRNYQNTQVIRTAARFISDFFDKNELIKKLHKLSYLDGLTGLKNRYSYNETLVELEAKQSLSLGVIYVDINGLKAVNDQKGHKYGDMLIVNLAKILDKIFPDTAYRIGGDEFIILLPNLEEALFDVKVLELRKALQTEKELKASIGHSWSNRQNAISEQIETADTRMYSEKQEYYAFELRNRKYESQLSANLICEIEENKFLILLQPKIDIIKNRLLGVNTLVRRIGNNGTLQEPLTFMPFYEKEGIVNHLELYIFKKICEMFKNINQHENTKNIQICIPFSRHTLLDNNIALKLESICEEYNISPESFILEFTHNKNELDDSVIRNAINKLTQSGFFVSLDVYGCAFLDLETSHISHFNEIKIDKSDYKTISNAQASKIKLKFSFEVSYNLDQLIEEDKQTEDNHILLKHRNYKDGNYHGPTQGDGYFLERPMTLEAFKDIYIK